MGFCTLCPCLHFFYSARRRRRRSPSEETGLDEQILLQATGTSTSHPRRCNCCGWFKRSRRGSCSSGGSRHDCRSTCKKGNTKNKDGFWQTKAVGTSTNWAKQKLTKHSQTQVHRDNVSDESAVASAGAQQGSNAAGSAEDSSLVAGLKRQATWFCSLPQLKLHPENLLSRKTSFRTN